MATKTFIYIYVEMVKTKQKNINNKQAIATKKNNAHAARDVLLPVGISMWMRFA